MENSSKLSKIERLKVKASNLIISSTSHGLPNIFRTQRISLKIMWLFFFVMCTCIGFFMVYSTISNYLKYEVVTRIEVINEIPAEFPSVTIINSKDPQSINPLKDQMPFCSFNSEPCTENDFETIYDNYGFVSFKFKKKLTYLTGISNGLLLIMFTNGTKGWGNDGIQVIIHNDTIDPEFYMGASQNGEVVANGFYNKISINRVFSEKLGPPYSTCIKNVNDIDAFHSDLYKYMLKNTNFTYRQKDCFNYCMGREMHKKVNKTNNKIENFYNVLYHYLKLMQDGSFKKESHVNDFYFKLLKGKVKEICSIYCPLECDSIRYDLTISKSKFLIDNFIFQMKSGQYPINEFFDRITLKDTQNIVVVSINYKELEYTNIKEIPKMDFFDLISNIGGNLGLFIGISFLSFAEIIEFLIEAIYIICEKRQFIKIPTNETN
jgi:hypothetical protein